MFRIQADCEKLAGQVQKMRGEYILGKIVLENPLEGIRVVMRALPNKIGFSGSIGISMDALRRMNRGEGLTNFRNVVQLLKKKLRSHSVSLVKGVILLSFSPESQPYATIRIEEERMEAQDPLGFLGSLFGGLGEDSVERERDGFAFSILVQMGEDEQVTLKEIPVDENLAAKYSEFFRLCETVVNGAYEISGVQSPDVSLVVQPTLVNSAKRPRKRPSPFGQIPGMPGMGQDIEQAISVERPDVTFDDIGGIPEAKRLVQMLSLALENPEVYQRWGARPPRGVILVGPPGNGKTLLARALANRTNATFYHVKVNDILSMWYGQSEQHMSRVFDLAKENAPSIIFFDEIDALGRSRDHLSGIAGDNVSSRVLTTLLQNMDGLEDLGRVIVMAATNRKDDVDLALLRAGRFDRHIPVPPPDDEGLLQILSIHMKKAEKSAGRELFQSFEREALVSKLRGMSGSDVAEVVRRVLEEKAVQEIEGKSPDIVSLGDLEREVAVYEHLKKQERAMGFSLKKNVQE